MDCLGLMVETPCVALYNRVSYVRLVATAGKEKIDDTHSLLLYSIALGPAKGRTAVFYKGECNWESIRSSAQRYRINLYYVISHGCLSWLLWGDSAGSQEHWHSLPAFLSIRQNLS